MAAVAPPLSVTDQPQRCIEQLLFIISHRDAEIEMLQEHLRDQLELCRLHADRAAEAKAAADRAQAHNQLLLTTRQLPPPPPPSLSPADLAALNALGPVERDAAWLRRVFVRGHASPPLGPYEVAGLYVDAFFWSGTAARPDAIVAAVAQVFPGVELVPTECGPRFRGLARAQVAPAFARVAPISLPMEPFVPFGSAAEPPPLTRPASAPGPSASSTGKRKQSLDTSLLQPEVTSKRVRSAHAAPAAIGHVEDPAGADNAGALPADVQPQLQLRSFDSTTTQPAAVRNSNSEADIQARAGEPQPDHEPLPVPHAAPSGQPAHIFPPTRDDRGALR